MKEKIKDNPLWLARIPLLVFIRIYQKTLSFDHGFPSILFPNGYCKFYPTCSEYGYGAVERHGVIKGGAMTVWRVLRCHPFSKGGHDPVPLKNSKSQFPNHK